MPIQGRLFLLLSLLIDGCKEPKSSPLLWVIMALFIGISVVCCFSGFVGETTHVSCKCNGENSWKDLFYNLLGFLILSLRQRSCLEGRFEIGFVCQVVLIYLYMHYRTYERFFIAISVVISFAFHYPVCYTTLSGILSVQFCVFSRIFILCLFLMIPYLYLLLFTSFSTNTASIIYIRSFHTSSCFGPPIWFGISRESSKLIVFLQFLHN